MQQRSTYPIPGSKYVGGYIGVGLQSHKHAVKSDAISTQFLHKHSVEKGISKIYLLKANKTILEERNKLIDR